MHKIMKFAFVGASALALSAGAAFADYELNILHINDFHARFEPINKFDSTCLAAEKEKNECFGGIARIKAAVDAERAKLAGQNVLLLSGGDEFQGSLFYTSYKSAPIAELMNGIGFDAVAIGNHEFDDGPEELAKFIGALKAPVISGNTLAGLDTPIADKFKGYVIKDMGGQKVAIVSVLATDTDETSSPGDSILFADEVSYLKDAVKEITAEGVNKIILLSHVGYVRDQQIAKAVDGIDVIVGAHSHTYLNSADPKAAGPYPTMVKDPAGVEVPIVQAYAYSKYLGNLKVTFDDAGVVKSASGAPMLLDGSVTPDAAFEARVAELGKPLEELRKKEIGESAEAIDGSRDNCRARECTMGVLVADAMLDRVKDQGIDIAIQNGGGLRASIDQGPITMGEVLTVLPFQNSIATFQLKGADVVAALENGLSQIDEGAGRFPQVAGLKYTFDKSKPAGSRVVSAEVKQGDAFVKLDPEKTYGVVSNNYMRGGGDGYKVFATKGMNAYDFGPNLEDAVAAYLTENRPYKPMLDDRITDATPAGYTPPPKEASAAAPAAPAAAAPAAAAPAAAPAPAAMATAPMAGSKYAVAKNDSLWAIAEKVYGEGGYWVKIAKANNLKKPNRIPVGLELEIPAK